MPSFVAFLRAINVGGKRMFAKAALVDAVEAAGFTDVVTYLNTGNVRFDSAMRSPTRIEETLEKAFRQAVGFDVPTIVMTPAELRAIAAAGAELDHDGSHYVSLLKTAPTAAGLTLVNDAAGEGERAVASGRAVHLLLGADYHTARLTNAAVEKHLGVATNRNLRVIRTVVDRWC